MKLIRDKYEDLIPSEKLEKVDNVTALKLSIEKITEELNELEEENYNDVFEYADVIEVLYNTARLQGISEKQINDAIKYKNNQRGSFKKILVLKD
jgi:predicted house-cleaning noncanonical NTP pyrophosphatase (MazG superfamily)